MKSNNLLAWAITLLVISALIIYLYFKSKKRKKGYFSMLQSFAEENGCTISTYDHWRKTLIGFGFGKIFFIRNASNNEVKKVIDLSDVKNCRIAKIIRIVKYNGENINVTDKIDLVVSLNNNTDVALEFYNNEYDNLTLTGELQYAEKWSDFINTSAKSNPGKGKNSKKITDPATKPKQYFRA